MRQAYIAGLFLAIAAQADAQRLPACDDTVASGQYLRCALRFEGRRLVAGVDGQVVGRHPLFRGFRMQRLVDGDSAIHYAQRHDRFERRANFFGVVGLALEIGALISLQAGGCDASPFYCDEWSTPAAVMIFGSVTTLIVSTHYSVKAAKASTRAIWWHNSRYAR